MGAERSAGEGTASLEKAIDVLEAVGDSGHGIAHLELADKVGLPRTTVYRILSTLVARGLVWRDPIRRVYCLGSRTIELARKAYAMPELVAAARAELRSLRDLTGETTYLATLDGTETVSLERCDGAHNVRSASALGVRKGLYCTSQGKAMLAALDEESRNAIVAQLDLAPLTKKTITDRRKLKAELKATAGRGYAIDEEEIVMGVRCVGAAIVDAKGRVRGAVSVAGPAFRMTRTRVEQLGPEVAEAARRVGAQLGEPEHASPMDPSRAVEGTLAAHGAYPRWSPRHEALFWADKVGCEVHRLDGGADRRIASVAGPVMGLVLHSHGLLVAHERGWNLLDVDGKSKPRSDWPGPELGALCAHPGGELWVAMRKGKGCVVGNPGPAGDVLDKWQVDEPLNAIAWDAKGETLHGVAPESGSILVMRPGIRGVRRLATLPRGSGRPSGLAFDVQGGLWTSLMDGWSVVRISADGALTRVIGVPVPTPNGVAFGGKDLRTLFVTSTRHGLSAEALASAPLSGTMFELEVGLAGIALPIAG